ncbi:MAG: HAMP domain-containing histidine kinase [Gammaproteobacteria bacterium]|nr:HAMP domain-containing histidine kinase [Gammaproteobacteria bacterium]
MRFIEIKKHGKGKIFITSELNDDMSLLRFKDTAGSVTNEIIFRLFEGFKTAKQEGTGIGLAFCKFTMQSFGGDISANCVDADCIEFVLSFPKVI